MPLVPKQAPQGNKEKTQNEFNIVFLEGSIFTSFHYKQDTHPEIEEKRERRGRKRGNKISTTLADATGPLDLSNLQGYKRDQESENDEENLQIADDEQQLQNSSVAKDDHVN